MVKPEQFDHLHLDNHLTVPLIECNIRNIFLEKSYIKCGGETSPRPLSEKIQIERISGSIV